MAITLNRKPSYNNPVRTALGSIQTTPYSQIIINFTGAQPLPSQIYVKTSQAGDISLENLAQQFTLVSAGVLRATLRVRTNQYTIINWRYATAYELSLKQPAVLTFNLQNIDVMRGRILETTFPTQFKINNNNFDPYQKLYQSSGGNPNILSSQEGLAVKTYQSDLFNNWIKTEWLTGVGGINELTAINTASGSFNIDTFYLSKKVYELLTRVAVSGNSYNDWLDAVWAHERYKLCEIPMYMGGLSKELVFQEVISNSSSENAAGNQPLGTLAGRGIMSKKHKGGHIIVKIDEPCYIMGIVSLTPRLDYSQGNKWDINLKTMDDLHKPGLDQIGFQDLITEQMAWWTTHWDTVNLKWIQVAAGKQPAWINYMTNVNQCRGNFAIKNDEMFMTLNRRYDAETIGGGSDITRIKDLTTYIDPAKYNFIFAETAWDSQNFWTQIAVDITARRKMSAKIMPNL